MFELYKARLNSYGSTIGQSVKKQSDSIMSETFKNDPNCKKILIQNGNSWKQEYAKYQKHVTQTILKDSVDYYLQFKPGVHYEIGSYVIIPDDTTFEPDAQLKEANVMKRNQWWLIVGRDNSNQFVRYNVLKCNWNFKWIVDGIIYSCYAALRHGNSGTGIENGDLISSVSGQLTAILPDLITTQTITYDVRFMLGNNKIYPKAYKVSKITDIIPPGIIQLVLLQDTFDVSKDNKDLGICDYYKQAIQPIDYVPTISIGKSVIKLAKGISTTIKLGVSDKFLTYTAFDENNNEITLADVTWKATCNAKNNKNEDIIFDDEFIVGVQSETNYFSIRTKTKNTYLIGSVVTIELSETTTGNYYSSFKMEVTGL